MRQILRLWRCTVIWLALNTAVLVALFVWGPHPWR